MIWVGFLLRHLPKRNALVRVVSKGNTLVEWCLELYLKQDNGQGVLSTQQQDQPITCTSSPPEKQLRTLQILEGIPLLARLAGKAASEMPGILSCSTCCELRIKVSITIYRPKTRPKCFGGLFLIESMIKKISFLRLEGTLSISFALLSRDLNFADLRTQ